MQLSQQGIDFVKNPGKAALIGAGVIGAGMLAKKALSRKKNKERSKRTNNIPTNATTYSGCEGKKKRTAEKIGETLHGHKEKRCQILR